MKQDNSNEILNDVTTNDYKYGFVTDIETDIIPTGLNEDIIRHISKKKKEPEWLLEFRLKAYAYWKTLEMPHWAHLNIPDIDYQAISYYAAPKTKEAPKSLDEVDPELRKTFDKLGISLEEQMKLSGIAVDAVMDSVSVRTTFREKLAELGCHFLLVQRGGERLSRFGETLFRLGCFVSGQFFLQRLTRPYSVTARSFISPKESGVLWNYLPISVSTPLIRDSSNEH